MTAHLLLTIPETADELRVNVATVYRLISKGRLKAINLAENGARSKTRIRRVDLEKYVLSCAAPEIRKGTAA